MSSSLGYKVKGVSRTLLKYRDRFGTVDVDAEVMAVSPFGYTLWIDSIPDSSERPRQEIIDRIARVFRHDEAFVDFFPDATRGRGFTLAPWLSEPIEDSDVAGYFGAWETANSWTDETDPEAQTRQLETLWCGVCEWAELVGAQRVIVEPPIRNRRALKGMGFKPKGFPIFTWLEYHASPEGGSIRSVLELLPQYGAGRLTFSTGHEILCIVSDDWRFIGVQPPTGDAAPHITFFRSLLADVRAAGAS